MCCCRIKNSAAIVELHFESHSICYRRHVEAQFKVVDVAWHVLEVDRRLPRRRNDSAKLPPRHADEAGCDLTGGKDGDGGCGEPMLRAGCGACISVARYVDVVRAAAIKISISNDTLPTSRGTVDAVEGRNAILSDIYFNSRSGTVVDSHSRRDVITPCRWRKSAVGQI